ncbi:hypothetical protein [Promicromonospora panici]|uniref:hypothetical protein n=1 Tax=Promicromonospora panici TaxID=2219658 RepID=UPI00101D3463|nr:hypothetical protein [Promicromonospora panici]
MTGRTNDSENTSENTSRPEGQDTSEAMDNKTEHDTDTTAVLPPAETPPTQEIAQATRQVPEGTTPGDSAPEGPASEGPALEGPAPEGAVHPAYGVAAARAQAEAEPAATAVQDAPAADDTDPLAPLRDPEPQASGPASGTQPGPTPHTQPQPVPVGTAQPQPAQQGQQAAQQAQQPAAKRGPRVGTAVWGLIVIAVGLGILAVSAGVIFDLGVALIVLLGAAGVILVVGSVISSVRRR